MKLGYRITLGSSDGFHTVTVFRWLETVRIAHFDTIEDAATYLRRVHKKLK